MNKYGFLLTQNPMGGSNLAEMALNTGRLYIRGNCPISDLDENFKVTHITLDMTTSPAMKYLLVEINERNDEKEYTFKCVAHWNIEQHNDLVTHAIAFNWCEDDFDQHPFNRRYFWFSR